MSTGTETQRLIDFLSQECQWQRVEPIKVSFYASAYFHLGEYDELSIRLIQWLGHLVEPAWNPARDWRKVNVMVGHDKKADWQEVPRLMEQLLEHQDDLTSKEFFREFEEIHPFRDGNGRVGALLYNWHKDTYHPMDLELPPNLWDDPRRAGVHL